MLNDNHQFDVVQYLRIYPAIVNEIPLIQKELELYLEYLKVPAEQVGAELEDPVLESCFACDAIFESNHVNVVSAALCGHRAHLECIRRLEKPICHFCGNGLRSALFSYIRSKQLTQRALKQLEDAEKEEEAAQSANPKPPTQS